MHDFVNAAMSLVPHSQVFLVSQLTQSSLPAGKSLFQAEIRESYSHEDRENSDWTLLPQTISVNNENSVNCSSPRG
jgi:hypothetical protein